MSAATKGTRSRSSSSKSGRVLVKRQALYCSKADILFFSVMLDCGFYLFKAFNKNYFPALIMPVMSPDAPAFCYSVDFFAF